MLSLLSLGLAALLGSGTANAGYTLSTEYNSENFFDQWTFFTGVDPTNGYVDYLDQATAQGAKLAQIQDNKIYMGVDTNETNPANGRKSVRVSSKMTFTHGLIIADIEHMPESVCGSWPAFWSFGAGWPNSGEIDIIEGVNSQASNQMTLHTGPGCSVTDDGSSGSTLTGQDCNAGSGNTGCPATTTDTNNYGDGFNANQGGVYAMDWTSDAISIWFFPRSKIPSDITSESPDPSTWGSPLAKFNGGSGCTIDNSFKNHNLVFDMTFCGDWADGPGVWAADQKCSASPGGSCKAYVGGNPQDFKDVYWLINSVKVYTDGTGSITGGSTPSGGSGSGSTPAATSAATGNGQYTQPAQSAAAQATTVVAAANSPATTAAPVAQPANTAANDGSGWQSTYHWNPPSNYKWTPPAGYNPYAGSKRDGEKAVEAKAFKA